MPTQRQTIDIQVVSEIKTSVRGREYFIIRDHEDKTFVCFTPELRECCQVSNSIDAEIESKEGSDSWLVNIYKDGKPIAEAKKPVFKKQYGKSPEELELSRKSFALSYAKDLAVAGKITVDEIENRAQCFYNWLIRKPEPTIDKLTKALKAEGAEVAKTSEPGKETKEQPEEFTAEDLKNWVAKNMKWKTATPILSFLVNKHKIPVEEIEANPLKVKEKIQKLENWVD